MTNMELYEAFRAVPQSAQKTIGGGRLKGMTDISPMWRIKTLTERFGPCGIGWKYTIDKQWSEQGKDEAAAFCNITFYFKWEGEWSEGIQATGGSKLVASEKSGLYTSDECYKMALTDAISVACKMLGMGADVYWDKDRTKYTAPEPDPERSNYLRAIAASGVDGRIIDRACVKRYGKRLNQLTTDQLAEVAVMMANKGEENASA